MTHSAKEPASPLNQRGGWRLVAQRPPQKKYQVAGLLAAEVPAIAATAGEYSSDEILVERIAAGDKLAMQVLFARHRAPVYRWLCTTFATSPTAAMRPGGG